MADTSFTKKNLNMVISDVILSIQNGQEEIFNISENVLKECEAIKKDIEKFKKNVLLIIKEVEKLEIEEKKSRKKLFIVSKDFGARSEEDIRDAYDEARDIQVKLITKKEEEKYLITQRNQLEIRLKKNFEIIEKAQSLMSKMKSVMDFLISDLTELGDTISTLEDKTQIGMRIIRAQEEERRRIARDIHDGPAQNIAALVIKTVIMEQLLKRGSVSIEQELSDIKRHLRAILKEIRSIMYDLRPASLDELGLVLTIKRMSSDISHSKDINIDVQSISENEINSSQIKLTIYRIIQEALNNIIKHSHAKNVSIKLDIKKNLISGVISDDGKGFDVNEALANKAASFGLSSMKERAEIMNGKINVKSQRGKGTRIYFSIPNEEEPYE